MTVSDDLDKLAEQEQALVFDRFDESDAYALGGAIRDEGLRAGLPIVVDIRFWDRPLFYAALPGSTCANAEWARRKANATRLYYKSSYRMYLQQGAAARVFPADFGHSAADHAIAGGAFPIRVRGVGAVGAVIVSGLPQRADHNLVVRAIATHLGLDAAALALAPGDEE